MNLDQLLSDTLHDDRLALPVPAETLQRVRGKRRNRQRLTVAGTAVGALAVVAAAVGISSAMSSPQAHLSPYAAGGPVPGITPAFVPQSGRDWLLTGEQADAWHASHTEPSPPPGQSTVASPAPLAQQSADLLAAVQASGLPSSATLRREDSVGGQPGVAAVHVTLADGSPVEVEVSHTREPFAYAAKGYEGNRTVDSAGAHVVDVAGTTSAAGIVPDASYSFAGRTGAEAVVVVTADGVVTEWWAPTSVPLADLQRWAIAAAQQ